MSNNDKSLEQLLAQQEKLAAEIEQKREAMRKTLRQDIEKMLSDAGVALEDVFADRFRKTARSSAQAEKGDGARVVRTPGTPKYFYDGTPVDGRSARREPVFESVKTNGKIDDKKAVDACMINPAWLKEQAPGVLKKLGVKSVEDYENKLKAA